MSDYLIHWGIKGQKWHVRRFQNKDGSLTPEGRIRYKDFNKEYKKFVRSLPNHNESKSVKQARKASNYIGDYSKLSKTNKEINAKYKRLETIGVEGNDYFGDTNYILPTASKKYRSAIESLNKSKKVWNTLIKDAGYDKETEDRIQYVLDYLDKHNHD